MPTVAGSVTLDSATGMAAMSVLQTLAQVTANEKVYVSSIPTRGGVYAVEVYDAETGVAGALTTLTARPNEDVSGTGATDWREDDGTTTTIYTEIDEATLDTADYIISPSGVDNYYYGRFDTGGLALTGLRILAVQLVVAAAAATAPFDGYQLNIALNISGVQVGMHDMTLSAAAYSINTHTYTYNPGTKKLWTIADVQAFDVSDEFMLHIGAGPSAAKVYQVYLNVITCAENRLAFGALDDSASALTANAWNTAAVLTPTGGAWTKDASGRHLYTVRRITPTGALVIPTLAGAAVPNPASGFSPTVDPTYGYITAMGDATPTVWGLVQRTSAPADSVDSQPYALMVEALVYSGQLAAQEFSNAAALVYGQVRLLAKPRFAIGSLLVKVKRRSDNVQLGSTVTFTVDEVNALPDAGNGWKLLDKQMASTATLAAATQYYIEISDTNAADTGAGSRYWAVVTLDVGDATTGVTAGFGSTTDRATINGAEADRYDIPATVQTVPTPPGGFTATRTVQNL